MMRGLEKIASLLKLYKLRVSLYVDKQPNDASARNLSFENAVIKVYIRILEFQACVVSHLWKGSFQQVARNTVKAEDFQGKLDDIEKADAECLLFTNLLDKEKDDRTREQQYMQLEQQTKLQRGIVEALDTTRKDRVADYDVEQSNKLMHSLSSDYDDHKNFNPKRVPGTCEWFLHSEEFLEWRDATDSRILWVSAGPGCGKSVLSRCLIDERHVCSSARASTMCYFFFRDGQAERQGGANALKAITHQLLKQHPRPDLVKYLLPRFQAHGDKLGSMFGELWNSMLETLADPATGEVVWVLDALDECMNFQRTRLLDCLTEIYSSEQFRNNKNIKLKVLITSRQYHDIDVRFRRLEGMAGYVQLDGDEQPEEISQEINLVIKDSVPHVASSLSVNDQAKIIEHLRSTPHRTYLWLHLMLKEIEHKIVAYNTEKRLASIIKKLPMSVYDAYERILERSTDRESARKILQIVIAAKRALTVSEMNVALALALQGRCSSYDALDRPSDQEFKSSVKQICGLFVSIVDQKVYLLHQTAREFLICQSELASQGWKHSVSLESGHSLLFRICVYLLCFSDFESPPWPSKTLRRNSGKTSERSRRWVDRHVLLQYAAEAWVDHYHQMQEISDNDLIEAGLELFSTSLKKLVTWWGVYTPYRSPPSENIHVACEIGWYAVVERMLDDGVDVNIRTHDSKACPLHVAARSDRNYAVVKLLLDRGADINAENFVRKRPLNSACSKNALRVAELLIDSGADVNASSDSGTALCDACTANSDGMVQLLVERGAKVNLAGIGRPTALCIACLHGRESIVRLLLDSGAEASKPSFIPNKHRSSSTSLKITPLHSAAWNDTVKVAQLLIDYGADVNAQSVQIGTPLVLAAYEGNYSLVEFLLDNGADVLATCDYFVNAFVAAAHGGDKRVIQLLLSRGARFCKSDWEGLTDSYSEGYLLKLDSIYEQVKDEDMQGTIEVLLAAEGLTSCYAQEISCKIRYLEYNVMTS